MNKDILSLKESLKRGIGKKGMSMALAGMLLFSGSLEAEAFKLDSPSVTSQEFNSYDGVKIFVNGRVVEFNESLGYPLLIDGRTYIPVRAVANAFNAHVYWDGRFKSAYLSKNGAMLDIEIGSDEVSFNNDVENFSKRNSKVTKIDSKAFIENGRTYLPLRVIFEQFGAKVEWNQSTKTVKVSNSYEENTKYIDFKDYNVREIKDVDLNREYSKILYDGNEIDKDYIKVLKLNDQYKVIEDNSKLYIFSHQYLFELNQIYKAHHLRKINLSGEKNGKYVIWNTNDEINDFVTELGFLDGYNTSFTYTTNQSLAETGTDSYLISSGDSEEAEFINQVVDKIVQEVKGKTSNQEEMIRLVNDKLCSLVDYDDNEIYYDHAVYHTLKNGTAVCSGYARTFKFIMDKLGIPCVTESGVLISTGENHAWNQVLVNGNWKIVDVTNNDANNKNMFLLIDLDDQLFNSLFKADESVSEELELAKLTLRLGD